MTVKQGSRRRCARRAAKRWSSVALGARRSGEGSHPAFHRSYRCPRCPTARFGSKPSAKEHLEFAHKSRQEPIIHPSSGGFRGGARGALARGEMVSAQYLRGARRGGEIFWPVGQKFWARGEMKTYIRHCTLPSPRPSGTKSTPASPPSNSAPVSPLHPYASDASSNPSHFSHHCH